jgi:hypothetical protein
MEPATWDRAGGRSRRRIAAPSVRERREADLFLADLLGPASESEDASGEIDGEDQPSPGAGGGPPTAATPTYDLLFIDQRLGGVTPAGPHCAVICPRGLTPAGGELDMILYLHGWRSTCGGAADHTMREMLRHDYFKSIPSTVGDSGKNVVLVAPTLGPKGEVGSDDEFLPAEPWQLLDAARARVQAGFRRTTLKPGKVILAGHSGAGPRILALLNRRDAELSRVIAVWAIDSFYGGTTRWRNAIEANPGITWTIVPSNGSDVDAYGRAINDAQSTNRLNNQRFLEPSAGHCALPAKALGQLLRDESRLTTRPPAPAPPPPPAQRSPSESFLVVAEGGRLTGALSAPTRPGATSRLIGARGHASVWPLEWRAHTDPGTRSEEAERFYESLVGEAETADEATPTAPRDIGKDAFFEEERVRAHMIVGGNPINPATGVTINKYDAPLVIHAWKTHRTDLPNPLQDSSIALQLEPGGRIFSSQYTIFRPAGLDIGGTATEEVPVAIFAGPGAELNRHGLRAAFDRNGRAVLVTLPGRERSPRFGFGITQAQLVSLFRAIGLAGVPRVRVLAGFSTGYRAVNGIINNTKSKRATPPAGTPTGSNPGTGLDLTGVRKVIYFDAFYSGSDPAPGKNTERALKAIHAETGGSARLVIYEVTSGGTPSPLAAARPTGMPVMHINIKPSIQKFTALALCRVVDMAIKDEYTDAAGVTRHGGKPVLDLLPKLPARGTVGSASGSGTTNVTSWCTDAEARAAAAAGPTLLTGLIQPHKLVGWAPPDIGEFQHDAHLFEFSWEHLVP